MKELYHIYINNEKIDLKRSRFGYRVVYPNRDENGKIIWVNLLFGGFGNLVTLVITLSIILLFLFGVHEMLGSCKDMAEHPCDYFGSIVCDDRPFNPIVDRERLSPNFNWSEVIKSGED